MLEAGNQQERDECVQGKTRIKETPIFGNVILYLLFRQCIIRFHNSLRIAAAINGRA